MRLPLIKIKSMPLKKLVILLMCVLIGYLPFSNMFPYVGVFKEIICLLICGCAVINQRFRFTWQSVLALFYVVLVLLAAFLNDSLDLLSKIDVIRYRCMYPITFGMLFFCFEYSKEEYVTLSERILSILYWTGLIVALVAVVEFIAPSLIYNLYGDRITTHLTVILNEEKERRLISTMSNPINLGFQMSLAVCGGLFFLHRKWHDLPGWQRIGCVFSLVLFVWVTMYTYSRVAYVVLAACITAFYLVQILFTKGQQKMKIVILIAGGVVALLVAVFLLANPNIATRFSHIGLAKFLGNSRFERAQNAFKEYDTGLWSVLFGHGAGRVMGESNQYVFELGYASLIFESGLIGILIFAMPVLSCIKDTISAVRNNDSDVLFKLICLCIIIGFCTAMIAEDAYFQLPFSLYYWLCVFLINAYNKNTAVEFKN